MSQLFEYKSGSAKKFFLKDEEGQRYFFTLECICSNIGAIRFFEDESFSTQIGIPTGFKFRDSSSNYTPAYNDSFMFTWTESYWLRHNGIIVLVIGQKKESSVSIGPGGAVEIL